MAQTVYSIRITLESIEVHDDQDWFAAGEIYFMARIDTHSTGRSPVFTASSGQTITLGGATWSHEVRVHGRSSVPLSIDVWDEDLVSDDSLGHLAVTVAPPWTPQRYRTRSPSGNFTLNWSVAQTVVTASRAGVGLVSRQYNGSPYASTLSSPKVAVVVITEILGLYQPGVDDRPPPIPAGTTRNSGYVAGYTSEDNLGRIFRNRAVNGSWNKDHQQIELTAHIETRGVPLPAGAKIRWTIEDPDDPTNEGPDVHIEAGRILDPNDYSGAGVRIGATAGDNDPNGRATAASGLEQIDPLYALSGTETAIDLPNFTSRVRFKTSDICGDNYRITAELINVPDFDLAVPFATGVMTVWERVDVEYVRMTTAPELPVDQIALHYEKARVQVDVGLKRIVPDVAAMGATDAAAGSACANYASSAGQFSREGTPGWFFIAAAHRFMPARTALVLYQGDAEAWGDTVRLPPAASLAPFSAHPAAVVRIFDPARVAGVVGTWPNDRTMHFKFRVDSRTGRDLLLVPHDFHLPESPSVSLLDAALGEYGFANGSPIKVQVLSHGDEALITAGISPGGVDIGGNHFFGGKLLVFLDASDPADSLVTLCHELCHAFDNAHKCGNWDWKNGVNRTACCMNYWFQFILDSATPRAPIPWTQNRQTADLCAPHIRRMRDYHLEDNPGLGW